jgi:2-polyprenyl-3-methyl-5-hydroxy-6-metoxy-1,4-benzoquinol methylase
MPDTVMVSSCPICRETRGQVVASYQAAEVAQAFVPRRLDRERNARLSALWHNGPCSLRRCDRCALTYADPFIAGDADFYEIASPDTSYPGQKWEFDRTYRALRERGLSQPKLLEIGAGNGSFLKPLIEDGCPAANLQAFEFSVSGRAAIDRMGITCMAADLRTVELNRSFDAVCMFQVLEHVDDYDGIFAALGRILRPGGHLFVATPNKAWIDSNESRQLLRDLPPNHLTRWSEASFAALARRFGWHLEACELEPALPLWAAARGFTDRYARRVGDEAPWESLWAQLAERLGNRSVAKLVKLGAALTSPACLAALAAALEGLPPANIWAHFRHTGIA